LGTAPVNPASDRVTILGCDRDNLGLNIDGARWLASFCHKTRVMVFCHLFCTSNLEPDQRRRGDEAQTRQPREKFMFTVLWNSLGFHVVDKLPTEAKMNSD
jgi:hypothetical protein